MFLAQKRLLHKCSKPANQFIFWFIVAIFQIVALDVMQDQRLSQMFLRYVPR